MTRRLRIISGLVLFAFVTMHLVNVSFGLHSIALMDRLRPIFMGVWTNPVGMLVLAACLIAHLALGLWSIYHRNTLRMSPTDAVQLVASLTIVPLLTPHIVGTAVAARYGVVGSFATLIPYFWIDAPLEGLRQVLLLSLLWIHGCVGVFTWMRIQPWWNRVGAFLYPLAVAVPVAGLLGFVEAGNQAIARIGSPAPAAPPMQLTLPFDEILAILSRINWTVFAIYLAVVVSVFAARAWRLHGQSGLVRVDFADGPTIEAGTGITLLDAARLNHVPIAHMCRGRGRCGTCRVRILDADAALPPPSPAEAETLARLGTAPDVRLACQLAPAGGRLRVERLMSPFMRTRDLHQAHPTTAHGEPETAADAA